MFDIFGKKEGTILYSNMTIKSILFYFPFLRYCCRQFFKGRGINRFSTKITFKKSIELLRIFSSKRWKLVKKIGAEFLFAKKEGKKERNFLRLLLPYRLSSKYIEGFSRFITRFSTESERRNRPPLRICFRFRAPQRFFSRLIQFFLTRFPLNPR